MSELLANRLKLDVSAPLLCASDSPTEPLSFLASCPAYAPTPLLRLPALARALNVGRVLIKDESNRMGLSSFKALGGVYAVLAEVRDRAEAALGHPVQPSSVLDPAIRALSSGLHFVCASDGNHGRAVAAGARIVGARCSVYLHEGVSEMRADHIRALGAAIVRHPGGYDDSVAQARLDATTNGWVLISDTIDDPSQAADIGPRRVMQGYGVIADEILRQIGPAEAPSHLFVQAGVGGLAASLTTQLAARMEKAPRVIVVEPDRAACLLESCRAGEAVEIADAGSTIYAMLECLRPSLPAWQVLRDRADFFLSVGDQWAAEAVRTLATPTEGDPRVLAGASGSAGLAGALAVAARPDWHTLMGLDSSSTLLLVATEGVTDAAEHRLLMGERDQQVPPHHDA